MGSPLLAARIPLICHPLTSALSSNGKATSPLILNKWV
jgi:hypothetical protein